MSLDHRDDVYALIVKKLQMDIDFNEYLITGDESLREALAKLNKTGKKNLFWLENRKLLGVINDGDIRRFILNGGSLDDPVKNAINRHPKFLFDTERNRAERFLVEQKISAVPIVDENLCVVDIVSCFDKVDISEATVRELTADDLPILLDFFGQMAGDTRAMFNRNDVNLIRATDFFAGRGAQDQIHFAAVSRQGNDEIIVGYVFLWDLDTKIPWLGIAVRESWKGRHLGRVLLEHAEKYAVAKGYGGIMLTSVPANVRAHSLYSRMGYEYCGNYPDGEFFFIRRFPHTQNN